jgi:hypothetical protein
MIGGMERPSGGSGDGREPWEEDDDWDPPVGGLITRLVPLAIAAGLLLVGLGRESAPSRSPGALVGGLGVILAAALLHVLALRFPRRYGLDGTAWIATIVAVVVGLGFGLAPEME